MGFIGVLGFAVYPGGAIRHAFRRTLETQSGGELRWVPERFDRQAVKIRVKNLGVARDEPPPP